MEIVASNTEADVVLDRLRSKAEYRLRDMTINLLRVLAHGGDRYVLLSQVLECASAWSAYEVARNNMGRRSYDLSYDAFKAALPEWTDYMRQRGCSDDDLSRWDSDGTTEEQNAMNRMLKFGARVLAGRMAGSATPTANAESGFWHGFMAAEKARQKRAETFRTLGHEGAMQSLRELGLTFR